MTRKKKFLSIQTSHKNVMTLFSTSSKGPSLITSINCLASQPLFLKSMLCTPSTGFAVICSAYLRNQPTYQPASQSIKQLASKLIQTQRAYATTCLPLHLSTYASRSIQKMQGSLTVYARAVENQRPQRTCGLRVESGPRQSHRLLRTIRQEAPVLPFFNRSFDKKRLKLLFSWYYANKGENAAFSLVETLQKLGFTHAMKAGISLGIDDLKVPPTKTQAITEAIELLSTTKASVSSGDVMALEEFQQFVDTWHRTSENLKTSVVHNFTKGFNSVQRQLFLSTQPTGPVSFSRVRSKVEQEGRSTITKGGTCPPLSNEPVENIISHNVNSQSEQKGNLKNPLTTNLALEVKTPLKHAQQVPKAQHRRSYGNTLNPVYMMAFSGARGNLSQVRQLVGMRGLMADPQGQLVEFPIQSNFREGLTVTEYMISCYGARKGLVDTALRTAAAGYLTRRLVDVAHHQIVRFVTCGTKGGVWISSQITQKIKQNQDVVLPSTWKVPLSVGQTIEKHHIDTTNKNDLVILSDKKPTTLYPGLARAQAKVRKKARLNSSVITRCVGRVLARDLPGIAFRNQEIDVSLGSSSFLRELYETIGIYVRSPLTCRAEIGVCQLCYGWSVSANRLVGLGEAVGIIAAQSIGEPGTQLTMRTFHTGGVFSGDIMEECRAKHEGVVFFQGPYMGLMVRTAGGAIAFCLKTPGILNIKGKDQFTTYTLAPNSLLFVRQGERIATGNLLAQIPNLPDVEENTGESTKTLVSFFSGEIRQIPTINESLENIRILAGQKNLPRSAFSVQKLPSQSPTSKSSYFVDFPSGPSYSQNLSVFPVKQTINMLPGSHRLGSNVGPGLPKDVVSVLHRTAQNTTANLCNLLVLRNERTRTSFPYVGQVEKGLDFRGSVGLDDTGSNSGFELKEQHLSLDRESSYCGQPENSIASSKDSNLIVLYNQIKRLLKKNIFKKKSNCYKTLIQVLPYINFDRTEDYHVPHNAIKFRPSPTLLSGFEIQHAYFQELLVKNKQMYPPGLMSNDNVVQKKTPKTLHRPIIPQLSPPNPITNVILVPTDLPKEINKGFFVKFGKILGLQSEISLHQRIGFSPPKKERGGIATKPLPPEDKTAVTYRRVPKTPEGDLRHTTSSLVRQKSSNLKKVDGHPKELPILVKNSAHLFWTKRLIIFFKCYKERSLSNIPLRGLLVSPVVTPTAQCPPRDYLSLRVLDKEGKTHLNVKKSQKNIYIHSIQKSLLNSHLQNTVNRRHRILSVLSSCALSTRFSRRPETPEGNLNNRKADKSKVVWTDATQLEFQGKNHSKYYKCKYLHKHIKIFSCSLTRKKKSTKSTELCFVENNRVNRLLSNLSNDTGISNAGEVFLLQGNTSFKKFQTDYSSTFNLSKQSGLLTHSDRVAYEIVVKKATTTSPCKTKYIPVDLKIGTIVNTGDEIFDDYASACCGQIIEKSTSGLTLRLTQNILYSNLKFRPASISPNVQNGHWLHKGTPLVTLPYISNVTGDIVAGIPKIEQLFEARGKALEEVVDEIWHSYRSVVVPQAKAVRECFKEIGLFLVGAIQKVYSSQGVHIADKHLEVIIRQISKRALIVDSGDTEFLADEFVDLNTIECVNWTTYGQIATYRPILIGITKASLTSHSFLSSASFQQTARVLERETFLEKTDRLLGLKERVMMGALIDAGTGGGGTKAGTTNVLLAQVTKKPTIQNIYQKLNFFSRRLIEQRQ